MKKLILILILTFFTTSCNNYITKNVYEKSYSGLQEQNAYHDVYAHLNYYELDSIPLENWITNDLKTDTIQIEQKTVMKAINNKSVYVFIFSKYIYPSKLYYNFIIRFSGDKKDLK